MPTNRRNRVNRQLAMLADRPRVAGMKRGNRWKYKVFCKQFSPEFSNWAAAMEYANGVASRVAQGA